jgi:undecaprenyl diphosphate synthase
VGPNDRIAALRAELAGRRLPAHVAIVMDGNGRWAEARRLPRLAGHREGSESVRAVTREARRLGIGALTLYAFSAQNWGRPPEEVAGLMDLLREYLIRERQELLDNEIRLEAIGELDKLPPHVREPLTELCAVTAPASRMVLTLALSYGSREELARVARDLAEEVSAGTLAAAAIDSAVVQSRLATRKLPDPDLLLRTGGEWRLSNFLLWQSAYTELMFLDVPWPEFREVQFLEALVDFQRRERRFGLTSAQIRTTD